MTEHDDRERRSTVSSEVSFATGVASGVILMLILAVAFQDFLLKLALYFKLQREGKAAASAAAEQVVDRTFDATSAFWSSKPLGR